MHIYAVSLLPLFKVRVAYICACLRCTLTDSLLTPSYTSPSSNPVFSIPQLEHCQVVKKQLWENEMTWLCCILPLLFLW